MTARETIALSLIQMDATGLSSTMCPIIMYVRKSVSEFVLAWSMARTIMPFLSQGKGLYNPEGSSPTVSSKIIDTSERSGTEGWPNYGGINLPTKTSGNEKFRLCHLYRAPY